MRGQPRSNEVRAQAVQLARLGIRPVEIATRLDVPVGSVRAWMSVAGVSMRQMAIDERERLPDLTMTEAVDVLAEAVNVPPSECERVRYNPALRDGPLKPGQPLFVRMSNADLKRLGDEPIIRKATPCAAIRSSTS